MSIYDKASLVLIPSGTKTSKVYSQKPTNGDGDFTFSRSTAATRVNASGNIEKETQNLLLHSNSFDDAIWSHGSITLTGGQAGYDGSNNAWELNKAAAAYVSLYQAISNSNVVTGTFYVKAGTLTTAALYSSTTTTPNAFAHFDLTNGNLLSSAGIVDASSEDVGNGWWRLSMVVSKGIFNLRIYPDWSGSTAGTIYVQDAQLEQGLVARDYIETTTTAIYGGITDNVPRLDYTDSSCPALLLEPQRTNLVTNSEYFDASSWSEYVFGGASLTRTFGYESPEGNNNAYKFDVVVGTGGVLLTDNITINPANAQTLSIWMKGQNGGEKVMLALRNSGSAGASGNVITLTSEWARYDVTLTTAAADRGFQFRMLSSNGVVDQTIYVYGATLEEGSYATSYIPTYGSAVTRNLEGCQVTSVSGLLGQTEGTLFAEFEIEQTDITLANRILSITDGTANNRIIILTNSSENIRFYINTSGSGVFDNFYTSAIGGIHKVAFAYSQSNLVGYMDGVQLFSVTGTYNVPSTSDIYFGTIEGGSTGAGLEGRGNQALVFPTRLSNEELATLTTI